MEWLQTKMVVFERESPIGWSPGQHKDSVAKVDFRITSTTPNIIIEIDGAQHYRGPYGHFQEFERQVKRDAIVECAAMDEGCIILRFGSWEEQSIMESIILQTIQGQNKANRLVGEDDYSFMGVRVHARFWELRMAGRELYREHLLDP